MIGINSKLTKRVTEDQDIARLLHDGYVVKYKDREIQWFYSKKEAIGFIKHTYGIDYFYKIWDFSDIKLEKFNGRKPKAGDLVIYDGTNNFNTLGEEPGGVGIIDGTRNIVFGIYGVYRDNKGVVSVSGGPCVIYDENDLTIAGLHNYTYWQFKDNPMNDDGVGFKMMVPLWRWNYKGEKK